MAEAFLDAVLLQDKVILFLLPILLFTAIITRTFVQGFGVLFAIFICVFVIPTPFVRPPGPLSPGIRDELFFSGMQWLAIDARQAGVARAGRVGFWLVYWRRRLAPARVLMALTVCVTVFFLVLPMALMPWNSTFAIQTASGPAPAADTARISLRNPRTCFPAARRAELSTDTAFVAATRVQRPQAVGRRGPARRRAGFGRLPDHHRTARTAARLAREAQLRAGGLLRGRRDALLAASRQIHHGPRWRWIAGACLDAAGKRGAKAAGSAAQLELTYSLTLLKPREYSVPTDGKRHALPGLGYCSAKVDEPGNRIDVDCFSAFTHPAQISAELNEISASRVYGRRRISRRRTRNGRTASA